MNKNWVNIADKKTNGDKMATTTADACGEMYGGVVAQLTADYPADYSVVFGSAGVARGVGVGPVTPAVTQTVDLFSTSTTVAVVNQQAVIEHTNRITHACGAWNICTTCLPGVSPPKAAGPTCVQFRESQSRMTAWKCDQK